MAWGMALGLGMAAVGGILGGNSAREQADAQYRQAQQQHMWANMKGSLQNDQVNRQRAQANAAKRYRNELIAQNANYVRAMSELDLEDKTNVAFANASNAYRANRTNAIAMNIARGVGRGGTSAAIKRMLRSRNAKDLITISEHKRRAQKQIESQQAAALAQRNFTFDEASVFIGGAPPVHQGGSAQTMAAAFQGAQAGLSMAGALSQLGGSPSNTTGELMGPPESLAGGGGMDPGTPGYYVYK